VGSGLLLLSKFILYIDNQVLIHLAKRFRRKAIHTEIAEIRHAVLHVALDTWSFYFFKKKGGHFFLVKNVHTHTYIVSSNSGKMSHSSSTIVFLFCWTTPLVGQCIGQHSLSAAAEKKRKSWLYWPFRPLL
jgi:hypothetical protein